GSQAVASITAELKREPRPDMSDQEKETLAKRRANAAVTALHLGHAELVWPLFEHRDDPRLRSYLIHRLRPLGADPEIFSQRLAAEPNVSAQRALILALGEYPSDTLPAASEERTTKQLLKRYRDDPDPGIHSAIEWLFRRWGRASQLKPIDKALA